MLPLRLRVDVVAMAMKGYTAFPKAPALLEPHHQIVFVISRTFIGVVLSLCREAVGVFCSIPPPSWLGKIILWLSVVFFFFHFVLFIYLRGWIKNFSKFFCNILIIKCMILPMSWSDVTGRDREGNLPMSPTRQGLTQGQTPEGRLKWW